MNIMKKYKFFVLLVVMTIIGLASIYKLTEIYDKRLVLKAFDNTNKVIIEMGVNTIKISNRDNIDKLINLLDIESWNKLIYYKKIFPFDFYNI
ncbi:MAG TPA: hypothetical protein GX707_13220 [Epulopiscium sp.]|nr:hypothetical protein [Candidatus Epulonipiscium sp.]